MMVQNIVVLKCWIVLDDMETIPNNFKKYSSFTFANGYMIIVQNKTAKDKYYATSSGGNLGSINMLLRHFDLILL